MRGCYFNSSDESVNLHDPIVPLSFLLSDDAVGVTLMLDFLIELDISSSMTTGAESSSVSSTSPSGPSQPFLSSGGKQGGA